jgi:hypothetical protein
MLVVSSPHSPGYPPGSGIRGSKWLRPLNRDVKIILAANRMHNLGLGIDNWGEDQQCYIVLCSLGNPFVVIETPRISTSKRRRTLFPPETFTLPLCFSLSDVEEAAQKQWV